MSINQKKNAPVLEIRFIPCPPEKVAAWEKAMQILVKIIEAECRKIAAGKWLKSLLWFYPAALSQKEDKKESRNYADKK